MSVKRTLSEKVAVPPRLAALAVEADQIIARLKGEGRPYLAHLLSTDAAKLIQSNADPRGFARWLRAADPGPGPRQMSRRRPLPVTGKAPRRVRPNVSTTGSDISEGMSGTEFAAVLLARYGVAA